MINLADISVNQLCEYYNHINRDVVHTHNGYHQQRDNDTILQIKKLLVHRGVLSHYVLDYEGKL